ncbi:MAG: hypothetical protein AAGE94_10155 [Acidobacteriota bacterium]
MPEEADEATILEEPGALGRLRDLRRAVLLLEQDEPLIAHFTS